MVAIIDDREDVWSRCPNLIHVKPYIFFAGTADINAPPSRPSTTPTSTTATAKPPDGAPFKVRHMTSSRNNNIKPPIAMATHHLQASNESKQPSSQLHVARKSNLHESTTAEDTPAIIDGANDQAIATAREKDNDGNNGSSIPEIHADRDTGSGTISHPQTNPDLSTSVHQETQEMKLDMPADHAPVEISDNSLITQSNSNANNNNENGDDPSNKKEDNSSSSSDSSSSSGEEEGDGDGVEQEGEVNGRNKRESSSSSSSSSGIDDNLFDSLDENVDDLDRDDSKGATAMEAGGVVDTSKLEGAYMVAVTEKLVREPAEGMEISMVEQDISAGSRGKVVEKADLTADSASGEYKNSCASVVHIQYNYT